MAEKVEKSMEIDKSVEFLYRTMLERDPRKRRVKLVQPHLLQLDFAALGDSSDDSDFKLNSDLEDDEEDDDDNANNDNSSKSSDDKDDDDDNDDDEDDSSHENSESDANNKKKKSKKKQNASEDENSQDDRKKKKEQISKDEEEEEDDDMSNTEMQTKRIKVPICCVCLGDSNSSVNEIIECDGCYAPVHEGCFGVSDSQSVSSSDSSSSMEPWFCDACKAGVRPHCELCPNKGGIFKETDTGRWVHLLCALYTPGMAFGDVEKLNNVTLFEMPFAKWGAKGAQRAGYLNEASPDEEIADPYYAYCKQHADRNSTRHHHRNWLALQSNLKQTAIERELNTVEKSRMQRKLLSHQSKYKLTKSLKPPCWVPKEKVPKMLLSNAYVLKQLLRKAEILGVTDDAGSVESRKKGYSAPAFNVDFISYYLERNEAIDSMRLKSGEMEKQKKELQREEKSLTAKYDDLKLELAGLQSSSIQIQQKGLRLWDYIMFLSGKRLRIPESVSFRNLPMSSPANKDASKSAGTSGPLQCCASCMKQHDQHLLAKCDKCNSHYHLSCLDPPLSRMPKKTKLQGWHCSMCSKDSANEGNEIESDNLDPNDNTVNLTATTTTTAATTMNSDAAAEDGANTNQRRLRKKSLIKEPLKYTTQFAQKLRDWREHKYRRRQKSSNKSHNNKSNQLTSPKVSSQIQPPRKNNNSNKNNGKNNKRAANTPLSISSSDSNNSQAEDDVVGEDEDDVERNGNREKPRSNKRIKLRQPPNITTVIRNTSTANAPTGIKITFTPPKFCGSGSSAVSKIEHLPGTNIASSGKLSNSQFQTSILSSICSGSGSGNIVINAADSSIKKSPTAGSRVNPVVVVKKSPQLTLNNESCNGSSARNLSADLTDAATNLALKPTKKIPIVLRKKIHLINNNDNNNDKNYCDGNNDGNNEIAENNNMTSQSTPVAALAEENDQTTRDDDDNEDDGDDDIIDDDQLIEITDSE
ncbi:hypothetical protein HELRODRAFT_188840 [Helobdella robusta]|uniref:PHD finger protein 14 n=1 Tax=Helobdella robusta TaxID=6412 RepID=T1FQE9_HELRO|nr:hypothetical protein HELRODRAFT_188840 [Helobdella robusta]ESN98625.1 hypothetical protein HELRODRAFT_188840 [Helobdella robusta]